VHLGSGAGAAGFIGKVSEVSWIQRCRDILFRQNSGGIEIPQRDLNLHLVRAQNLNYHMDDFELLAVDEESMVPLEAFYRPPLKTAVALSEAYFDSLHNTFPFVDGDRYRQIIQQYSQHTPSAYLEERRWLSTANVIFGLGSKWLHLAAPESGYRAEDHLMFYARARALGLDHRLSFDHPTLEQVQALGVLALYLFVNNSIARYVTWCRSLPLACPKLTPGKVVDGAWSCHPACNCARPPTTGHCWIYQRIRKGHQVQDVVRPVHSRNYARRIYR
jgi:hypothetical protein